jgi:hypothetical protein
MFLLKQKDLNARVKAKSASIMLQTAGFSIKQKIHGDITIGRGLAPADEPGGHKLRVSERSA